MRHSLFLAAAALLFAASAALARQEDKVDICHIPPGNPSAAHMISVGESAVPAHEAHGDVVEVGPEVCDGLDNDCTGEVDDNLSGTGQRCPASTGTCGTTECVDGELECIPIPGAPPELCTTIGIDDNCNGLIDEGCTVPIP